MATLATYFQKSGAAVAIDGHGARTVQPAITASADPFELNGVPNDDVFLFMKRIDNSRLVRQSDPNAKAECLSAIGAVFVVAAVAGSLVAPHVASIMASQQIQDLRERQVSLQTERRRLDVEEEKLINAARLAAIAPGHDLKPPVAGQVVRLQPKSEPSFAMNEAGRTR